MCDLRLRLRPLRISDEGVARQAHAEFAADDFPFLLGWGDDTGWDEYVDAKRTHAYGKALPPAWVANTFLLADSKGEVLGRVSVRHRLNDELLHEGGHIGVGVRPGYRRRGLGTAMLR